jgi:hypothetical protein
MYRYIVDNAITYTPDDVDLFRESPFATWMERLSLENPDHGIPPDTQFTDSPATLQQADIAATLRGEGRNVELIDRALEEPERRSLTLAAMRSGADFIVTGQLAVGALSGCANLLMRTSGYSELGGFLYIPCENEEVASVSSIFQLSCLAELLQNLQGQLPPQMLIIRDGADVVPMQTEDHIHYYRAVQQHFFAAMSEFRKHRMPDPALSSHFGRWSECASEVLKQRALRDQHQEEEQEVEEAQEEPIEMPQLLVASGSASSQPQYSDEVIASPAPAFGSNALAEGETSGVVTGVTLAEQARLLAPDRFRKRTAPGHTPNLARFGPSGSPREISGGSKPEHNRRSSDAALENLQFIGSSIIGSTVGSTVISTEPSREGQADDSAPAPNLRDTTAQAQIEPEGAGLEPDFVPALDMELRKPIFLPPDPIPAVESVPERRKPPATREDDSFGIAGSVVDLDGAPPPELAAGIPRNGASTEDNLRRAEGIESKPEPAPAKPSLTNPSLSEPSLNKAAPAPGIFSDSLITGEEFDES